MLLPQSVFAATASVLIAIAPGTSAVETIAPLVGLPNVTIIDYDVSGRNAAAVRHSINALRPTDANDGTRVDGYSKYAFRWRWHNDGRGKCSATIDDLSFSATVTVPRLSEARASKQLQEEFDRYRRSLLRHEDGHVRYAWEHRGDIVTAINAATCDTVQTAAQDAAKTIAAHDIAYDKRPSTGRRR